MKKNEAGKIITQIKNFNSAGKVLIFIGVVLSMVSFLMISISGLISPQTIHLEGRFWWVNIGMWRVDHSLGRVYGSTSATISAIGVIEILIFALTFLICITGIAMSLKAHSMTRRAFIDKTLMFASICTFIVATATFVLFITAIPNINDITNNPVSNWMWNSANVDTINLKLTMSYTTGGWVTFAVIVSFGAVVIASLVPYIIKRYFFPRLSWW